jgi:galactokinase
VDVPARAERLNEEFRRRFGRAPDGVWAAPGRVNLLGEHTDYNDGLVLPFAIDRQAVVAAAPRSDGHIGCWSRQLSGTGDDSWRRYPRAVVAAVRDADLLPRGFGVDLAIDSDVPVGAGLSSSSAIEVAVALALLDLVGARLPAVDVARLCQRAENVHVGAPTGLLDPMASLSARAGHAYLLDCRTLSGTHVPLELDGLALLVLDTRVAHAVADGGYAERRATCARASDLLGISSLRDATADDLPRLPEPERRRVRHVLRENERVRAAAELLAEGRTSEIGPLLDASHVSLRDDYEVSCPELDVAVDQARAAGALGARMTGAGFGGSAVALVPADRVEHVRSTVDEGFAAHGWRRPTVFMVHPSAEAGSVR